MFLSLISFLNRLSLIFPSNLKVLVFSYTFWNDLSENLVSDVSSLGLLVIIILELGIPKGLINFSVKGSQGLLSLFSLIKFTPDVSSSMPKVF